MEPNFKRIDKWSFSYLDKYYSGSGIYVMQFPNGKRYLGKTKHFSDRLRQHFRDFSFASDWHAAARTTFTKLQMKPLWVVPNFEPDEYNIIRYHFKKDHPEWKRLTKKRKDFLWEKYVKPEIEKAKEKEKKWIEDNKDNYFDKETHGVTRYQMACDFFKNVQLWLWEVPENQITQAENYCLNQIAALNKKENYYNTAYPKEGQ